jgi:EAL domain-containing protein (putative c-di-GMP-specific phosphodiesterase class I)
MESIRLLRRRGDSIYIDDFGTGQAWPICYVSPSKLSK